MNSNFKVTFGYVETLITIGQWDLHGLNINQKSKINIHILLTVHKTQHKCGKKLLICQLLFSLSHKFPEAHVLMGFFHTIAVIWGNNCTGGSQISSTDQYHLSQWERGMCMNMMLGGALGGEKDILKKINGRWQAKDRCKVP